MMGANENIYELKLFNGDNILCLAAPWDEETNEIYIKGALQILPHPVNTSFGENRFMVLKPWNLSIDTILEYSTLSPYGILSATVPSEKIATEYLKVLDNLMERYSQIYVDDQQLDMFDDDIFFDSDVTISFDNLETKPKDNIISISSFLKRPKK